MTYRRALLVTELEGHAEPSFCALGRVAPKLEHLVVVVRLPASTFSWFSHGSVPEPEQASSEALQILRAAAAVVAPSTQFELAADPTVEALLELVTTATIDLLVLGSPSLQNMAILAALRRRQGLAVLAAEVDGPPGPIREICCIALGQRGLESIGAFLREHVEPAVHVTLLSPDVPLSDDLVKLRQIAGIEAAVTARRLSAARLRGCFDAPVLDKTVDLFVVASVPASFLLGTARLPAPMLLLPPRPSTRSVWQRSIDIVDLVDDGGPLRARVDYVAAVGDQAQVEDQAIAFVSGGRVVATVTTRAGTAELPAGLKASSLGVMRAHDDARSYPVEAIEQSISVIGPGERPLVLFDAELADDTLGELSELTRAFTDILAVRLRPTRSCRSVRARLRRLGLPTRVIDARAVLDEGDALDVSEVLDPVRLSRVAAKLRAAAFPVTAIVHGGAIAPLCHGFIAWSALDRATGGMETVARPTDVTPVTPVMLSPSWAESPVIGGNRVELELDNAQARTWLLSAIARSSDTVHLQVYMAQDDEVGSAVEAALAQAGAHGVRVRVLIDSLHGLHGSFGISNPLLERLAKLSGVEVRALRPITETPSLAELKRRDHRKLVVVDGRVALVGGRNLSREYYTGFEETRLTPESLWRDVPWLDGGARVEGPAVAALSESFLGAWTEAGGTGFPIATPPPVGTVEARVVVHHGLADARTLEAYRLLIDAARSHVYVINGFPLMLELQHALLGALHRGVRVRALVGHVTPTHGSEPFKGPWGPARTAATELVHSRMDPISEAGGDVYYFAVSDLPGWDPELGAVYSHVHAKVMSVDGLRSTVGSANFDITSAYWESELMLVVEDAALARSLEKKLDVLIAGSVRVTRDDPAWQQLARRRAWMRHWPGALSV